MLIRGPFAVIRVLMSCPHPGGTRQRSDACFCEFLWILCEAKAIIPEAHTDVTTCNIRAHSISNKKVKYKQSSRTQRARELCLYINSFKSVPYACGKQWRYCDGQSR